MNVAKYNIKILQIYAQNLQDKLALLHYDIKDAICKDQEKREFKAVERIKSNPKYFYSYAKTLSQVKSNISMLMNDNGNVVTDPKPIADMLQNQFISVFSDPNSANTKDPDFPAPAVAHPMDDLADYSCVSNDSIINAISQISSDSASGPDGIPVILLKNCGTELCEPIRLIWSESFKLGKVHNFYKQSHISPLYKKGDRSKALNYRPVALTSHIVKIYERIVRENMIKFIEENKLLCENQHGFRSGRSCLTQLLSHIDDVLTGLINGADTDAIYLDFAKAFDKVDHKLLIKKLRRLGLDDRVVLWIESFLTDRTQHVVVKGIASFIAAVLSGVPQGSVLGPLLFILFINDMQLCIKYSTIRFFADDSRILKHISCQQHVKELQEDLNNVILWASQNNMSLHEDKFELITHKTCLHSLLYELPFTACEFTYTVSTGEVLFPVTQIRDLGIHISSDLSWSINVNIMCARARSVSSWVLSAFKTRDRVTMVTLYKSLIRSLLEYCCPLWNPQKISDMQSLEAVQRSFTSRIWGIQHLNYWERLKALKLMSLQRRRERYIILHMWKILHKLCPNDINIVFSQPSRLGIRAEVPRICKSSSQHNQTLYDNSFAVIGPRVWNTLPGRLHLLADLASFKNKLTEYLTTIPDNPPVSGYSGANGNSLLDWKQARNGEYNIARVVGGYAMAQ